MTIGCYENLLDLLKEKGDFSFVILDIGSELSERALALLQRAESLVVISQTDAVSSKLMKKFYKRIDLLPEIDCIVISNQYHHDEMRIPGKPVFGELARYTDTEQLMQDPLFYEIALSLLGND